MCGKAPPYRDRFTQKLCEAMPRRQKRRSLSTTIETNRKATGFPPIKRHSREE
jgi:hypothetical protein